MLTTLSIRDVVLIERLDISFGAGLTVLTGETGAGKSILLDSLGLALGERAGPGLIKAGCNQSSVAAVFSPSAGHPAYALLREQGIEAEGEIVLRRVVTRDGRSRGFANDTPVSAALLRQLGATLVEIQGQNDQIGLAAPGAHTGLLDAFGVAASIRAAAASRHRAWRETVARLDASRTALAAAQRDQDFLSHAVAELAALAPEPGEEERMAIERQRLQQHERRAEIIAAAIAELSPTSQPRGRNAPGPAAALRSASRVLQRLPAPVEAEAAALAALDRAGEALAEAEAHLDRLAEQLPADSRLLERTEERLFALRALARKHGVPVSELATLHADLSARLATLTTDAADVARLEAAAASARAAYIEACATLSEARKMAAERLDRAIARELPPLRLDRARFATGIVDLDETSWGPDGRDAVHFLIATNPGQPPGPIGRIASGGELSRLMLALKVVLAGGSPATTLVFDEVDAGIGGATAASVGERLARVAQQVQVLLVTHSPQVAARGADHFRVSKTVRQGRAETKVERLDEMMRREEIARMLAGEKVTDAARAAADSLLGVA